MECRPDFGDRNCVELTCNLSFGPFAGLMELTLLILKRRFPLNPKFRNFGQKSNGINHFDTVPREYLTGAVISVGRSDQNVPFHLTKWLSLVPLFFYLAYKHNDQTRGSLGQQLECTVPFPKFQSGMFLSGKCPSSLVMSI